ncbi:hypothetical protein B0T20DRAFT_72438 [Sordaria brevicollis]|uniref:Uncharacterized protein n=1 Tax=Sordaria brevicollis TaxID=83679 RepID=A0AAE0U6C6_SORBR|nr:hypothetical protein B0T20DRAFT_72438 [Sordaria brevicollis]
MIRTSKPSCSLPSTAKGKPLLPLTARKKKQKVQVRTLLGHCLYRRVILWTIAVLSISALTLSKRGVSISKGETTIIKAENRTPAQTQTQRQTDEAENAATFMFLLADAYEKSKMKEERKSPQWLRFNRLDGFFQGLKTLVPAKDHRPEYPKQDDEQDSLPLSVTFSRTPTPTPYVPQPDYRSSQYVSSHHDVKPCYLDKKETIPVPNVLAYNGLPQGLPEPVIGSHKLFGLRDDVCFDRFGRYGPYGLGYSYDDGGLDVGMDTEKNGSQYVWAKTGKIDYSKVNWGDAQSRCLEANKDRFRQPPNTTTTAPTEGLNKEQKQVFQQHQRKKIPRTAIVVRLYVGFPWTEHSVLNFRAMISEVALQSGGEYTVHFLLHVRDNDEPIWADPKAVQKVLDDNVPPEFHSLCTLWSEDQMRLFYPGRFARSFTNPSFGDIHGVYRSAHFPLQHFAQEHPEYEHFWNWEMDMRWIGNYYELFDRLGAWAKKQSRHEMWERSERYYIPHYHGSWENFTQLVHNQTVASGRRPVMGPVQYPGYLKLRSEKRGVSFLPPTCPKDAVTIMKPRPYSNRLPQAKGKAHRHHHHHLRAGSPDDDLEATISTSSPSNDEDLTACGIDEDADLITLNPIFDADSSGWVFHLDITGYDRSHPPPPRRASIITASRMSRRLLNVMHEETYRFHHAMFTEMFPTTMALHHGLKAVYAPHPVYLDRQWDLETIDKTFNGGRDHTTSGKGSPYQYQNEYHHKGSTWYYDAQFAGTLWRRWLGYAQVEGPAGGKRGRRRRGVGRLRGD